MMEHGKEEIRDYILDRIDDLEGLSYAEELHNELFNTDYYIIGTYKAKQWCGDDTFDIIEKIREYEADNFGEVNTDFSDPEKVVNMYVYIIGEEILSDCYEHLEGELTQEKIDAIKETIK
jgi:DNA replication protein DnaC